MFYVDNRDNGADSAAFNSAWEGSRWKDAPAVLTGHLGGSTNCMRRVLTVSKSE